MKLYDIYRSNIKTGDLFFTASTAFFSKIIRLVTKSEVSHVGIFIWLEDRLFIIESVEWKGVVLMPARQRLEAEKFFYWGKIFHKMSFDEIKRRVFHNEKDNQYFPPKIWSKYDLSGALLSKFFDTKTSKSYCSEYVTKALSLKLNGLNRGTFPSDLALLCANNYLKINF